MSEKLYISVDRCSRHGILALCINRGNAGKRLTSGKCCGSWDEEVANWPMTPDRLREIAADLIAEANRS